jgi:opacity protein-like surface antigen
MKSLTVESALFTLLVSLPLSAAAQERVPYVGSAAAGFDIGVFAPRSDELSGSLVLNGTYEYYLNPRVSVRAGLGWTNPGFNLGAVNSLMQVPLTIGGDYNWDVGQWHPFLGGGIGVYFLQFRSEQPSTDNTDTRFGLNAGGGVEYFLNRSLTLRGEARYHDIEDARGEEPSGMAFTIGLKRYF